MRPLRSLLAGLAACVALAACDMPVSAVSVPTSPRAAPESRSGPSAASEALVRYYARVQNDQLTQGLMRTDGGGPDTPFDADDLAANFERIAFFNEYVGTLQLGRVGGAVRLRRWEGPVRFGLEFGDSVSPQMRQQDRGAVQAYAGRLARVTGHPITLSQTRANFHVMVLSEDDRLSVRDRVRRLVPRASEATINLFEDVPRAIHCLVVAFSDPDEPQKYITAVALIRAEHPDLLRLSCVHEELAQGLGLANDSPAARPSIFNDDDEFALLTDHDEMLLRMLYDPRLRPGMSLQEARPVLRIIARELMGQVL